MRLNPYSFQFTIEFVVSGFGRASYVSKGAVIMRFIEFDKRAPVGVEVRIVPYQRDRHLSSKITNITGTILRTSRYELVGCKF